MSSSKSPQVFIQVTDSAVHAALCHNGKLWQLVRQSISSSDLYCLGTIYKTKVVKRLSPLHAVCELKDRTGFLESPAKAAPEGAWIMAQIRRPAWDGKDPTLTTDIYQRHRYLVHQPMATEITVPIGLEKTLASAINALKSISWCGEIRPQAKNTDINFLLSVARQQQQNWTGLQSNYEKRDGVDVLQGGESDLDRFFQSLDKVEKIHVDQAVYFKQLELDFSAQMPDLKDKLALYKGPNIFSEFDILDQWHDACENIIHLPNGARLRFDITPTLTAIDIDSSAALSDAVEINRVVTAELARLITLKNIGGIIVVDYLKMKQNSDRLMIQQKLESEMALDPLQPRVLGFTKAGLCEITRPRRGSLLLEPQSN